MQTFFKQNTCGLNTAKQNNAMQCAWYKIYYNLFTLCWKLRADVLKIPTHQLNLSPPTINHFISTNDGNVKANKTFFFLVLEVLGLWICSIWNQHEVTTQISWPNYIKVNKIKTKIVVFMHLWEHNRGENSLNNLNQKQICVTVSKMVGVNRVGMCFSVDCVWHVAWQRYIWRQVSPAEQRATFRPPFGNVYGERKKVSDATRFGFYAIFRNCSTVSSSTASENIS